MWSTTWVRRASMPDRTANDSFRSLLRQHRLAAGLTQAELAERAGLAQRTIEDLERGVARPRRETARRLSAALGLRAPRDAWIEEATVAPRSGRHRPARAVTGMSAAITEEASDGASLTSMSGGQRARLPTPVSSF